ncbi:MAG TPA: hypothetical protein VGQ03_09705 [Nitrososphaera sp.]|jgi:hypothetical protein|nr:hypothetical protein [Nitrososphaera sp.]
MNSAVFLAAIAFIVAISLSLHALASEESEPNPEFQDENNPSLNSTGDYPILERLSEKGNYLVRLAWPQLPLNPDNAFDLQIYFLDPADSSGTNVTVAQPDYSNTTGSGQRGGNITVPVTSDHYLDVESYNITIYTGDGSVLWQRLDRPGMAGTPGERVLVGNYTGPVTIEITDIRPAGETATSGESGTDSVRFSASIVPEFPLVLIPLIAAAAGFIAISRFKPSLKWS